MNIHSSKKMLDMTAGGPGSGRHKEGYSGDAGKQAKSLSRMGYERGEERNPKGYSSYEPSPVRDTTWKHSSGATAVVTKNSADPYTSTTTLDAPQAHHDAFNKLMSGPASGRQMYPKMTKTSDGPRKKSAV